MTDATLQYFRSISESMQTSPTNWQWVGVHMSQRMFGITEARAKEYAARHGGVAQAMASLYDNAEAIPEITSLSQIREG